MSKHFSIERFIHATLVMFALASVTNVANHLYSNGHNLVTSYGIGIALGGSLVAVAIMLSKIQPRRGDWLPFALALAGLALVGGLSGLVQYYAYLAHTEPAQAAIYGFGFPLIGEGLIAIVATFYAAYRRRERVRSATDATREQIAQAIGEALADVDVSKVKKYVERRVDAIVRHQVEQVCDEFMSDNGRADSDNEGTDPTDSEQETANVQTDMAELNRISQGKRRQAADERRDNLLGLLANDYAGADIDDLNMSKIGRVIGVSGKTIGRDIEQLRASGMLNGVVK